MQALDEALIAGSRWGSGIRRHGNGREMSPSTRPLSLLRDLNALPLYSTFSISSNDIPIQQNRLSMIAIA